MVFSSITFLFYFLPLTLAIYFIVPKKLKNSVLLMSSLLFYAWGEPKFIVFMIISVIQGYILGLLIEKYNGRKQSKLFLIFSVIISLGLLGYCKYADFFIENFSSLTGISLELIGIALPVGISFYTFQILSYTVDVYRGEAKAQRNIINLAAYIAMFPQLIAGPIVRYSDIARQLENREHTVEKASYGIRRFVIGLSKKVLLANNLAQLCDVFKASEDKSVLFFWVYAISASLYIYFDFSGYSDMAVGLGKILGFDFVENFNYPYISKSVTEFWRRWHISLGSWFRDYLYIPLGGNRCSKGRWLFNILVVWMATGLWHGAAWNFVIWGLYFALFLAVEKLLLGKYLEKAKVFNHIYLIILVVISFVIFDSSDMGQAYKTIGAMFGTGDYPLVSAEGMYYLRSYGLIIFAGIIGSAPFIRNILSKAENSDKTRTLINIAEPIVLFTLLLLSTAFLVDGSFNPFLYFRF